MTTIETSRRERKKDETRERIFKEAVRLFRERGFEATTIDEITERADVAKGTFFNYFPRKESVLAYLSEKRLVVAEENAEVILADQRPAREKLLQIYGDAALAYQEERDLSRFVLMELMNRAFAPSFEAGHGRRWQSLILRVMEQGQKSGELRPDLDPVRAEAVLTGVYYCALYTWVNCPETCFDLQHELGEQLRLVLGGLVR